MPQTCPVCLRVNPDEAEYCCRDGAALGGATERRGPVAVGSQPFPRAFVFPSGRTCRTFDEMTLACEDLWTEALALLRDGILEAFFGELGRADLSGAARRFAFETDLEQGLDRLLAALPGEVREPARLAVQPLEINLGRIGRRADHRFVLHLQNEGMGLLRGSIACSDANWLVLGDGDGAPHKVFQCRHDGGVPVRVLGRRVRGGPRGVEGLLLVESNGGSAVVTVRAEAPVTPFADGVLAGADSPRALAVKARAAPREAAPLFESGAVAAWYEANGWTYPVQGPPASGVGAVQQFFEALGLAAPPRVEIAETRLWLEGAPGDALETAVVVQTQESRPVFAHAVSAAPWLHVGKAVRNGRAARIPLHVPAVPDRPGQRLTGRVEVTANGNQRFTVEVGLTVAAARKSATRTSRPTAAAPARPGVWLWLLAGFLLLAAVGAAGTAVAVVVLAPETPKAAPADPPPPEGAR